MAWTIRRAESHRDTKPTGLDGADKPCEKDTNLWDWKVILHSLSAIVFVSKNGGFTGSRQTTNGLCICEKNSHNGIQSNAAWGHGVYL